MSLLLWELCVSEHEAGPAGWVPRLRSGPVQSTEPGRRLVLALTACVLRSVRQGADCAAVLPSVPADRSQELDDERRVEKRVRPGVVREGTEGKARGEWSVWRSWLRGVVGDSRSLTAPPHPGAEPLFSWCSWCCSNSLVAGRGVGEGGSALTSWHMTVG